MTVLEKANLKSTLIAVKLGGSILHKETLLANLLADIESLKKDEVQVSIIHGGGAAINKKLNKMNKATETFQGLRITDEETLGVVSEELSLINHMITSKLSSFGIRAIGFHPASNHLFTCQKMTLANCNVDLGFVGKIIACQTSKLKECLAKGVVPVIAPLGIDESETLYNINADHAALAVAVALGVHKFINITDVPGLLKDPSDPASLISNLDEKEAKELLSDGQIKGGMKPKLESCLEALSAGISSVQIVSAEHPHALLKAARQSESIGSRIFKREAHQYPHLSS